MHVPGGNDGGPHGPRETGGRSGRLKRLGYWLVVVLSVAWTIRNHGRFESSLAEAEDLAPMVGVMSALVVLWAGGLAVVCFCAARRTARSLRRDPLAWVRSFHDLGRASASVLADLAESRAFWLGWRISWAATCLFSLLPAVVSVVVLGSSGLGIAGLAAASLGVNASWRLPVDVRMRRLRASARELPLVPLSGGV